MRGPARAGSAHFRHVGGRRHNRLGVDLVREIDVAWGAIRPINDAFAPRSTTRAVLRIGCCATCALHVSWHALPSKGCARMYKSIRQ